MIFMDYKITDYSTKETPKKIERMDIRDFEDGQKIDQTFSVKFKKPLTNHTNKPGKWFEFRVSDRTQEIGVKCWNADDRLYSSFNRGDVVRIKGIVKRKFRGEGLEINVDPTASDYIRKCPPSEYRIEDFVATTEKNISEMTDELMKKIESVKNDNLKKLLLSFFTDKGFLKEFQKSPAAMEKHQNTIGGLLEHTLNVVAICETLASVYPDLDRDLLLTGAILHDIGKTREFEVTTNIDVSEEGMLRGHISIGEKMLLERMSKIHDLPKTLEMKLSHILLSHHGKLEFGSPKIPQFPEALAVHFADELDAKLSYSIRLKKEARTEDAHIWTKDFGHIYLK